MIKTKIMLAVIATLIATWTLFSLIGYILSDLSLRDCYTYNATLFMMLVFGWIPAVILASDLNDTLKEN